MKVARLLPGLLVVLVLAMAARLSTLALPPYVSEVSVGVLAGLAVANLAPVPTRVLPGVRFAAGSMLRIGIVLLGARLSFADVVMTGAESVILIVVGLGLVIGLTVLMTRAFHLPPRLAILLGVGTAICGNSAIAAIAPVVEADETEISVAIGMITLFGTLAVIVYPLIGLMSGMSDALFGQWVGLAVSDTSQVTAAAFAYSDDAGNTATIVKLTRNTLIGPAVVVAGLVYPLVLRRTGDPVTEGRASVLRSIPPFVLGFIALAVLSSLGLIPVFLRDASSDVARFLILVALTGLGIQTNLRRVWSVGLKPVWTALILVSALSIVALASSSWLRG